MPALAPSSAARCTRPLAGCSVALALCLAAAGPSVADDAYASQGATSDAMTVEQYLDLQSQADDDDDAALMLGAYVAGLFTGIVHVNDRLDRERQFCPPDDFVPELRVLLNFIDAAAEPFREDLADAAEHGLDALLLDALAEQLPCD